ncbi:helix-turn-helix domain-containing protein [Clostridium sp. FP1]|uniref:helix-turn-helix domain-containing protein n=1 Tax=Clostridium sp. FP1 TaxID=2724076 RepID=UPI0013E978A3|nr:helix-turn-helix transcriptional regulator [Clostridium sp. FP1]MBZ9635559.1 helix-turn-helix domain-containing protein [Clostridium sp. FP1]
MQFNNRLRALRQDSDLTQDELSKALHIDRKTLSNYETAYRTPNIYLVIKMADYFNISTDYLLGRTNIQTPYPKKHK